MDPGTPSSLGTLMVRLYNKDNCKNYAEVTSPSTHTAFAYIEEVENGLTLLKKKNAKNYTSNAVTNVRALRTKGE